MEKIVAIMIKDCVRFFPKQNLGIVCLKASKCYRACPCAEEKNVAETFKLREDYEEQNK